MLVFVPGSSVCDNTIGEETEKPCYKNKNSNFLRSYSHDILLSALPAATHNALMRQAALFYFCVSCWLSFFFLLETIQ